MQELWLILLGTVLVNNVLLVQLLGVSALAHSTGRIGGALRLGAATTVLLVATGAATYLAQRWLLEPLGLPQLRLPVAMLSMVAAAALLELGSNQLDARLHRALITLRPFMIANTAVLGTALIGAERAASLAATLFQGLATGLGFTLVAVLFASLRERLEATPMPAAFAGSPASLIAAGLMALAFMGFARMV